MVGRLGAVVVEVRVVGLETTVGGCWSSRWISRTRVMISAMMTTNAPMPTTHSQKVFDRRGGSGSFGAGPYDPYCCPYCCGSTAVWFGWAVPESAGYSNAWDAYAGSSG
ncbi:Uncharacterised protein [Mycobacteroides abscessus]|nr:Uncharacterised protein [Mycobacteroides abscessus]